MLFLDKKFFTLISLLAKMQKITDLSIDYSLIPSNVPAICIPYVFENIGEKRIEGIFKDLDIGTVNRIDLVPTQNQAPNGSKVNRVFIHLNWKIDADTDKIRTKLLCGKEVKVLYDGKYFWKISASRAKEVTPHHKQVPKDTKPRIEMDDDENVPRKEHRGPPRGAPRGAPRDYRPKEDYMPKHVAPPMAPCLSDFPSLSLQHPEVFVKPRSDSLDEEEFQPKTPPTPQTPPPRNTRPLADIDHQEKVQDMTYVGVEGPPPKVSKKKVSKKAVAKEQMKIVEESVDDEDEDSKA